MKKTILICGHGPGISDAVARKFGAEGFAVALAARSADKLDAAVKALGAKGITAAAFPTDLGNLQAVKQLVSSVHAKLGPLSVLHWNAYAFGAGDIAADPAELQNSLNVSATGLWTAVQAAHGDLKEQKGAVLVTGGALCFYDPQVDAMAVEDHVVVFGERHLRHLLLSYMKYYNGARTHLSLEKDAPVSRAVERAGQILCRPILGGLHHQYVRI